MQSSSLQKGGGVKNEFFEGLAYGIPAGLLLWVLVIIIWEVL